MEAVVGEVFPRLGLGLIFSIAIGGIAWWRGSLTSSGWLGAILVGTLTFGFGGWVWGITLIAFFVSSSLLSHYKQRVKAERVGEKFSKGGRRDFAQTLANGATGALLAVAYALLGEPPIILAGFAGAMATVTADTWATELGVLSPTPPRLITTLQPVEPGTSGGVTMVGMAASVGGGVFIGGVLWSGLTVSHLLAVPPDPPRFVWLVPTALIGGVVGSLADSVLGATLQACYASPSGGETERAIAQDGTPHRLIRGWRWLNNDLVNFLSSLAGAGMAVLYLLATGQGGHTP